MVYSKAFVVAAVAAMMTVSHAAPQLQQQVDVWDTDPINEAQFDGPGRPIADDTWGKTDVWGDDDSSASDEIEDQSDLAVGFEGEDQVPSGSGGGSSSAVIIVIAAVAGLMAIVGAAVLVRKQQDNSSRRREEKNRSVLASSPRESVLTL